MSDLSRGAVGRSRGALSLILADRVASVAFSASFHSGAGTNTACARDPMRGFPNIIMTHCTELRAGLEGHRRFCSSAAGCDSAAGRHRPVPGY